MKTDLILQTILLHIDLLASPSSSGNSLTDAARKSMRQTTMDLLYYLYDHGKLDSVTFRALRDHVGYAYVNGGF